MLRSLLVACAVLMFGAVVPSATAAPVEAPPLEAYGRLPEVERVSLSPSGNRMAVVSVVGDERRLTVADLTTRQALVSTPLGDSKLAGLTWAGESRLLVTKRETSDLGTHDRSRIYDLYGVLVINVDTKANFWVFGKGGRVGAVFGLYGVREVGGRWYGFYTGAESLGEQPYLYRVDLDTGERKAVSAMGVRGGRWLVGADGEILARADYDGSAKIWKLYQGDGKKLVMTRTGADKDSHLEGAGRTPGTVVIAVQEDDQGYDYQEVSLADGAVTPLEAPGMITDTIQASDGRLIGLETHEQPGAFLFDARQAARVKGAAKAFPGYRFRLDSYTPDLGRMVVFTDGGDDSGTYWLVDVKTGKADPIGHAYSAVTPAQVGPTRLIKYRAADGLEIEGVLTLPAGREAKGLPLIVMPHGGPFVLGDDVGFDWWAQAFASKGYAVLQPNYRGTFGYGAAFHRAAFGEWGRKMQTDLSDGVAALAAQGIVDPKRVCIVGASYGGYAAVAGVTTQSGVYRCAVSVGGLLDLKEWVYGDLSGYSKSDSAIYLRKVLGFSSAGDPGLAAISPEQQAGRASAPILLIHGKDDVVVPRRFSEDMERALKRAGKPVELVLLDGEDHYFSTTRMRTEMVKASVGFVIRYNPPG